MEQPHGTQVIVREQRGHVALHRSTIEVVEGPDVGTSFQCVTPRVSIGTAPSNHLALTDDTVSAHHAELMMKGERYVVRDVGSTNGTWIGGEEIIEAYVATSKRITFGNTTVEFRPNVEFLPIQDTREYFGDLVGRTPMMKSMFGLLERISRTELGCVVLGETGVGKEMVARAIHDSSARRERPFVVVDCASVNRELLALDLFGHEVGAATKTESRRAGGFEFARGGTLFLDEVGELPLDLQQQLLRVLERRELKQPGAEQTISVDVRIIAATHRDLEKRVAEGTFREDLFYRLAEIILRIPRLDDRLEDIPLLAATLLPRHDVTENGLARLGTLRYPGNVRQLRNLLRRAAALSDAGRVDAAAIDQAVLISARPPIPRNQSTSSAIPLCEGETIKAARTKWLDTLEPRYFEAVLERCGGDLDAAAAHAKIHRKTFARTLRQHGVDVPED